MKAKDSTFSILNVLKRPVVTEKAEQISANGCYVFRVLKQADKITIRHAVEAAFDVKVRSVHIVNVKSKKRRFRMREGTLPGWKKAYVKLKAGQRIDLEQE